MKENLLTLFRSHFREDVISISEIRAHASSRRIFRLRGSENMAVGVSNADTRENTAFVEFTRHFLNKGLPVPKLYAVNLKQGVYLVEDLGDTTFLQLLDKDRGETGEIRPETLEILFQIMRALPKFQVEGAEGPHLYFCYQSREFDKASAIRDMMYFEREFLQRTDLKWRAADLHGDFERLADFIRAAGTKFFMYRDFQSRNIMVCKGRPWFLDYQAGRKGPAQYDVVSFLYQSRANLPQEIRDQALDTYLEALGNLASFPREDFFYYLDGFILIRLMQVLATYGYQGWGLRKEYFLGSIPYAIGNLKLTLSRARIPVEMRELAGVLTALIEESEKGILGKSGPQPG